MSETYDFIIVGSKSWPKKKKKEPPSLGARTLLECMLVLTKYLFFPATTGGPAGCSAAYVLANSAAKPRVLLLEAGGKLDARDLRVDGKRWLTFQENGGRLKTIAMLIT